MDYICSYGKDELRVAAATIDEARAEAARVFAVPEHLQYGIMVAAQLPGRVRTIRTGESSYAKCGPFSVRWTSERPDEVVVKREGSDEERILNWRDFA